MCWHQEQALAGIASGSIQRTADWLAFVTERLRRLCALQSYRLIGAAPFSAERPICPGRSLPMRGCRFLSLLRRKRRESTCRASATKEVRGVKYLLAACPIHRGCTIQVVFGDDTDRRIPFPDPSLKQIAEQDFPGLVPIEAEHLKSDAVHPSTSI